MNTDLKKLETSLIHKIAITLLDGIGAINAKKLIAYCGGVEEVFKTSRKDLLKIPGINSGLANNILGNNVMERASEELKFIEKQGINCIFYLDKEYPIKLKNCEDSPILLYCKGSFSFSDRKIISIVGTRNATHYGKEFIAQFIKDLKPYDPIIVSGLAYGIDVTAHKQAMKNGLQTIGVVAHGLDIIYPAAHRSISKEMQETGGVMSEYVSGTKAGPERFPMRNRIVAGLADAVIVVESAKTGGSMITADLANGYSRDVYAVPGRTMDTYSQGCNYLIQSNRAHLINNAQELIDMLGWKNESPKNVQSQMFFELNIDEEKIVDLLRKHGEITIDEISLSSSLPMSKVSSNLLNLEFNGVVLSRPGKKYLLA
ncbi:MAG: DNA processing protein [Patiriisocius sp.]